MIRDEITHALAQMTAQDSFDDGVICQVYRGCTNPGTLKGPEGVRSCQACIDRYKAERVENKRKQMESMLRDHEKNGVVFPDGFLDFECDPEIKAINPDAWTKFEEWNADRNAYIFGPVGVGKTYMAHLMLRRVMSGLGNYKVWSRNIAIVSARRFCKATDRFDEGKGLLQTLESASILLLDDLDKGNWNTERLGALWELLDVRSGAKRFTIVTANVSAKDIREVLRASTGGNTSLADATLDRMKPCLTIELNGRSQRT